MWVRENCRTTRTQQVNAYQWNRGFTLIEIVIVVLIIGLIALLLLPRIAGISKKKKKTAI
ncbi:MAG: prepilin-type N-terminal cleavage/methylation domain-containing protein, partial [Nitrospirae bacterium]|nr:prepilin-type N-terminal cleavage/methylation domain-containing protein [Nitrospirota bacterium]